MLDLDHERTLVEISSGGGAHRASACMLPDATDMVVAGDNRLGDRPGYKYKYLNATQLFPSSDQF